MASSLIVPVLGQAFDGLTKIIGEFHMSPEEKAQAQQAIADAQQKAQQAAVDYDVQMNTIASQNIRADDATGDKFTQHARPWFMYIIEMILGFNYIVVPLWQVVWGKAPAPFNLPDNLLILFGTCITGYVFNRTAEKISAMPGDSQIRLPFGLGSVGNKS